MSSLQTSTTEITFYTYDLIRDESGLPIKKIYLQRIIHEHPYAIRQLSKILTPQNKDLFSRPICFLKKADIAALPAIFQRNGWGRFFEAIYFAVPSKSCPSSMDPNEKDSKTNDLEDTIRILNELIEENSAETDPQLLPIIHNTLGIFYFRALGVQADYQKAFAHFQFAADHGLAEAHVYLGTFYGNGLSVPKNIYSAIDQFKTAAKMGSIEALYQLGNIFALENNKIEDSKPYFAEAADKKHPIALFWMGYSAAEQAKSKPISRSKKKSLEQNAVNLYKNAAALDCVTAQLALGQAYTLGYLGLAAKIPDAIKYLTFAAQNRSAEGASNLGVIYASSKNYKKTEYEKGFAFLLKSCRYKPEHLHASVNNLNKILQTLEKDPSPDIQDLKARLSTEANAYFRKHHIAITKEKQTISAPQYNANDNQSHNRSALQQRETNYQTFIAYGHTLRNIHLKTLSPELEKLFLEEEAARPERSKQLVEHFLPTLSHFTNLYTDYVRMYGEDDPNVDFPTFLKGVNSELNEDAQIFLLSRLYLLNARDIMYLYRLLKKQYFFDRLVSVIPFHRWENKEIIAHIQMMLVNFYLRILSEDYNQIGILINDPITSLNHLNETCYWDMCSLINTANDHNHHQNILERFIVITMTYNMTLKSLEADTLQKIKTSLISQVLNLPDLKGDKIEEFDRLLKKYKNHSPIILENLKKLGISDISSTISIATKTLKNHSQVNKYKTKSLEIVTFFKDRYDHFHADRIEAERKARENIQLLKMTEQSQKEITLREVLKKQTLKTQHKILEKVREQISSTEHSMYKTLALQEYLEKLESLNQQTFAFHSYSQKLRDKFTKTHRAFQTLLAADSTNSTPPTPVLHQAPEVPSSASPEKVNLRVEILQQLEARETSKAQKELETKAKKEERAQARATKRTDYEETHAIMAIESVDTSVSDMQTLLTIHSFEDKITEEIFTTQSDRHAGNAVFLLNLINQSNSLIEIRSHITHGQNLEPLIGQSLRLPNIKAPLQHYSLRVNDQYRITFYWDKGTRKAYHVWFGDYHS